MESLETPKKLILKPPIFGMNSEKYRRTFQGRAKKDNLPTQLHRISQWVKIYNLFIMILIQGVPGTLCT